jgi:ABC-type Fe3+-siderophore transport system permease subunit
MVDRTCSRWLRILRVVLGGTLLTLALALTFPARSAVALAKRPSHQSKRRAPQPRVMPVNMPNSASKVRPPAGFHTDVLMPLEEGQKGLQRQVEFLTGMTQRRSDTLARRIASFADQLYPLASAVQQVTATQQLLTATVRSVRVLLVIIVGLLLVLCGAVFLFLYQLKQLGGSRFYDRKQVAKPHRPDETFDPQWKVSS